MTEEGDKFNFEKQRREVGLGEEENKNRAKKSGKSLSAEVANPSDFFEQYENTLVRNREVEWLNGERDSPDLKVKKTNTSKKEHDLPAFWKKEGDSPQEQTSSIQGQEVSSVVTARGSGQVEQPSCQEASIQSGMNMFNSILGQDPNAQNHTKQPSSALVTQSKAEEESSNSTPRFNQQRSDGLLNAQPVTQGASTIQAGRNFQNSSPLSRLSSPNQIPKATNPPNNVANISKPATNFMGSINATPNNQSNVAGFNKQSFTGLSPKISSPKQGNIFSPQIFSMMKTVKFSHQKQSSSETLKGANYRKLVERCTKYRQKIREMVKSSSGEKEKLIDIITLMTLDHPKPLEREMIINKSDRLISLHEQIQEGKRKRWEQDNPIKLDDHADDTHYPGFNLNVYLANSEEYIVKRLAEVPEEKMSQIKSMPAISKLYAKVENMSGEQFAHKFSKMVEKMKAEMIASLERSMLLLSSKRKAESLTQRCQKQQENLRQKSKIIQQQLQKIKEKQQYCRQFIAKCCRYLEVQSPQQLPKQELNYHLDSLQELTQSSQRLKGELKHMRLLFKQISEGQPHRTITSHFCSFSRTLLELLNELQSFPQPK